MYKVQQITANASQKQNLVLPDGTQISLSMQFLPLQQSWVANLSYNTFALNGFAVVNNPNLLHQWHNLLPFGLGCFSSGTREPSQIGDFFSGYASLYVLSASDVASYSNLLLSGVVG